MSLGVVGSHPNRKRPLGQGALYTRRVTLASPGRREAHWWGYALSAPRHSTHVPWEGLRLGPRAAPTGPSLSCGEVSSQRTGLRARTDWAGDAMDPALGRGLADASSSGAWNRLMASQVSSMAEVRHSARRSHNPIQTTLPPPSKKKNN